MVSLIKKKNINKFNPLFGYAWVECGNAFESCDSMNVVVSFYTKKVNSIETSR